MKSQLEALKARRTVEEEVDELKAQIQALQDELHQERAQRQTLIAANAK